MYFIHYAQTFPVYFTIYVKSMRNISFTQISAAYDNIQTNI